MHVQEMIRPDLIDLNIQAEDESGVFAIVAEKLGWLGYVKQGYLQGILTRETIFPTGLITQNMTLALPHADSKLIEVPFIFIARTTQPVHVFQMGDNQRIETRNFLFLGIKNPKDQVGVLQQMMNLLMNRAFVESFSHCETKEEVYKLVLNTI